MCVTPCILSVWSVQGGQGGEMKEKNKNENNTISYTKRVPADLP
jgi:hypothetical protein